jgi:hypothetical protein
MYRRSFLTLSAAACAQPETTPNAVRVQRWPFLGLELRATALLLTELLSEEKSDRKGDSIRQITLQLLSNTLNFRPSLQGQLVECAQQFRALHALPDTYPQALAAIRGSNQSLLSAVHTATGPMRTALKPSDLWRLSVMIRAYYFSKVVTRDLNWGGIPTRWNPQPLESELAGFGKYSFVPTSDGCQLNTEGTSPVATMIEVLRNLFCWPIHFDRGTAETSGKAFLDVPEVSSLSVSFQPKWLLPLAEQAGMRITATTQHVRMTSPDSPLRLPLKLKGGNQSLFQIIEQTKLQMTARGIELATGRAPLPLLMRRNIPIVEGTRPTDLLLQEFAQSSRQRLSWTLTMTDKNRLQLSLEPAQLLYHGLWLNQTIRLRQEDLMFD